LRVSAVTPRRDGVFPMTYAIAMGVRRADKEFVNEIDRALARKRHEIEAVLAQFHVPQVDLAGGDDGGTK
jgi:mxaJ protein